MKKKLVLLVVAAVLVPALLRPELADQTLAAARARAGNAEALLQAYYDHIILPRKTPTQTAEARKFKLDAAREATAALKRYDALRSEMVGISPADKVTAGRCRLITLDPDRPSIQPEADQKAILDQARWEFSQAWQADTRNPGAYAGLIETSRLQDDRKAGEAVINQVSSDIKQAQVFNLAVGRFYLEVEAPDLALNFLKKVAPGKPGEAEPELYQAAAYYMTGNAGQAKELAAAALGKRPSCETAALFLEHLDGMASAAHGGSPGPRGSRNLVDVGAAFYQRSDFGIAIFFFEKAVSVMPSDSRALYYLGNGLAYRAKALGRKEEAVRAAGVLTKAMKLGGMPDVTHDAALVPLGLAYQVAGQYDDAAKVYREIIAADPQFWRYYFFLGDCLKAQGKQKEADSAYAKGKELAPKQSYVKGARWAAVDEKIGEVTDCSAATELGPGAAVIQGRIVIMGQPFAEAEVQLLLDQCGKATTAVETNENGEVKITLPPGKYIYNGLRVAHYPGPGEPTVADLIYVPGKLDKLHEGVFVISAAAMIAPKKPGEFEAKAGENPELSFVASFVQALKIAAPAEGTKLPLAAAGPFEVQWEQVPGAKHYLVDLYKIMPEAGGETLSPVKEQVLTPMSKISLASLFSAGLASPAPGDYGLVVSAVDPAGQVVARSEGLRRFSVE